LSGKDIPRPPPVAHHTAEAESVALRSTDARLPRAGIWHGDPHTGASVKDRRVMRVDHFDVAGTALVFARHTAGAQVFAMPLK
jgi:hypothetical protein